MKLRTLIWAVLALLPLSCVREAFRGDAPEGEILFAVADTKAQLLESAASVEAAYGQAGIGLVAYGYDRADGVRTRYPSGDEAFNSFDYDARKAYRLTRDGNGLWHTDVRSLHWTREVSYLAFYAFAPFDLPVVSGEHSLPQISGFTLEDPATQADILVAEAADCDAMPPVSAQRVPLVFSHPLAALRICNHTSSALTEVRLRDVRDRASAWSFADKTWSLKAHTTSYTLADVPAGATSEKYLLLPQELSGVTLCFTAGGKPVEARLSGRWEAGQLFTYTVDDRVWSYVLDLPQTELYLDFGATENVIPLESYKTDGYNLVQENWMVSCFADAACTVPVDQPSWLSVSDNAAAGEAGTASSLRITTTENSEAGIEQILGDDAIRYAPERNYWNLSDPNGTLGYTQETANCYIVNAPGWYVFPLVMGNAIKNYNWNYDAFYGKTDYRGNIIQGDARLGGWTLSPWTWTNVVSGTPAWAKVLWEDVDGLILTDENGYLPALVQGYSSAIIGGIDPQNGYSHYQLVFYVPNTLARMSGNAVIGVYDYEGVLMWSWHIWVTDYVPGVGDVTLGGVRFMPRNIGEVRFVNSAPERTVYVKLTSEGDAALSRVIRLVKAGGTGSQVTRSYNPYFQHGRKDPFIPGMGLDDMPVYGENSLASRTEEHSAIRTSGVAAQLEVWEAIQHPNYFGASTGGSYAWYWTAADHSAFWSSSAKTIYDPSPVGYHVPSSADFDVLPFDRATYVQDASASMDGLVIPFTNRRTSNPGGGSYPGLITLNGGVYHAALWSADVDGDNNARYLRVQANGHAVVSIRGREALAVRAVAD